MPAVEGGGACKTRGDADAAVTAANAVLDKSTARAARIMTRMIARPRKARRHEARECLDVFGGPSDAEAAAGLTPGMALTA
jgi:hypothetical protein